MNKMFQILDQETKLFGFGVAALSNTRLTVKDLAAIIEKLKEQRISLIYWHSDPDDVISQRAAAVMGGYLVDRKVTYYIKLQQEMGPDEGLSDKIEEYTGVEPDEALQSLALQSGVFSRFNIDPRFPRKLFEKLYKLWIVKSTRKIIAESVLIFRENDKTVGMITLNRDGRKCKIGLFATDCSTRRKGIGTALLKAALSWAVLKECEEVEVVTQGVNEAARRLYEKCGFRVRKVENLYHFWLS